MGKNVKVSGYFDITPKLTDYDRYYLFNFCATQHYKRDTKKLEDIFKGRNGYNGEYGKEGEFYIQHILDPSGNYVMFKNKKDPASTIIDNTNPPESQPSIFCPWKPNHNGTRLIPVESTNYHRYNRLLQCLLHKIFDRLNKNGTKYKLNGKLIIDLKNRDYIKQVELIDNDIIHSDIKKDSISKFAKDGIEIPSDTTNKTNGRISISGTPNTNSEFRQIYKRTDYQIVDQLTNMTRDKKIKWTNSDDVENLMYTIIKLEGGVNLKVNLVFREINSNKNYISIYFDRKYSMKHYKTITGYYVNGIISEIKSKTQSN